jgi:adenosyl cobinamide kinase/adenosyl cobinamide phosphate guanylyltransferase
MIFVFGGAYQGKLNWCRKNYKIREEDIFFCQKEKQAELDLGKKVISGIHFYIYSLLLKGKDPEKEMEELLPCLKDKIVIGDDISSGIVPMDQMDRAWRDHTGKVMQLLAKEADSVIRVFCGIGEVIK